MKQIFCAPTKNTYFNFKSNFPMDASVISFEEQQSEFLNKAHHQVYFLLLLESLETSKDRRQATSRN